MTLEVKDGKPDAEKMRMIFENFKFLKVAHLRELEKRVTIGQITYSKMVESINEMAYDFYMEKLSLLRKQAMTDNDLIKHDNTPHRCPVCNGNGIVPSGFYLQTIGDWTSYSTIPESCRSCFGCGIVWSKDQTPTKGLE